MSWQRKVVKLRAMVCDRCGKVLGEQDPELMWWIRKRDAIEYATEDGWSFSARAWHVEGGNHVCPDCIPHEPDWDDEHEAAYVDGTVALDCEWCRPVVPLEPAAPAQ